MHTKEEARLVSPKRRQARAALLQVSQPRTPCYKLAARHGCRELAAWFAEPGITGFHLRLVEPGHVRAGDALVLLDRPAHGVTVLETNRVLAVPELSGPWLETFEDRLAGGLLEGPPRSGKDGGEHSAPG